MSELPQDWHQHWMVMALLIYPVKFRAERWKDHPDGQPEYSPTFATEREVKDWIRDQVNAHGMD